MRRNVTDLQASSAQIEKKNEGVLGKSVRSVWGKVNDRVW